jgi:conserved oligomeric Golgi complex subunit 3
LELFEDTSALKCPPKATLAKRAKSYSHFYEAAVSYLGKDVKKEQQMDTFEALESRDIVPCFERTFESYEGELLDASQQDYQYVTC